MFGQPKAVCPGAVTTPLALSSFNVPGNEEFAASKGIVGSQALLFPDDIADAMMVRFIRLFPFAYV
jgi:hypothetical protein